MPLITERSLFPAALTITIALMLLLCVVLPVVVHASSLHEKLLMLGQHPTQHASSSINIDNATKVRGLSVNRDDITESQLANTALTPLLRHHATVWGLTDTEEMRYQHLMQNKSDVRYRHLHLSPIEVLGLNARDENERADLAKRAAELNIERAARELAWAKAYKHAVQHQLVGLPHVLPFDMTPYSPYSASPITWQDNDTVIVFLEPDTAFDSTLTSLLTHLHNNPSLQVHLFFIGNHVSRDTLQTWAIRHTIPSDLVKQKRLTLNRDHNRYQTWKNKQHTMTTDNTTLPIMVLIRHGQSQLLSTALF